jgi:hypothetical protein
MIAMECAAHEAKRVLERAPTKDEMRRGGAVECGQAALPSPTPTPPPLEPMVVTLRAAIALSGLSRSSLYLKAAAGEVIFLKNKSRILVDYQSLKAAVAALPRAVIKIAG